MGNEDDIAALEAALTRSMDREVLAVFADKLQAMGDPRGELIALDLEIERSGSTRELAERRAAVQQAWLGPELGAIETRFGFVENLVIDETREMPPTGLARAIRGMTIIGDVEVLERALRASTASASSQLLRLELSATSGDLPIEQIAHGAETLARFWAGCPNLDRLALRGNRVLESCMHPGVKRLVLTGFRALDLAVIEPMPSVEEIDFAFDDERSRDDGERLEMQQADQRWIYPIFGAEKLPALRRLDVSRNDREFMFSRWDWGHEERTGDIPVFSWLTDQRVLSQLTHLRVPSVCDDTDHRHLVRVLEQTSHLEELVVARIDRDYRVPPLAHPTARIVVPPWAPRRYANDRFEVTEWIGPDELLGIAIARDTERDQRVRLTFAGEVSHSAEQLRPILAADVAGLAPVVYLGPAVGDGGAMMIAELIPRGEVLEIKPADAARIAAFGTDLVALVARVHRAGTVLGTIRPESVYLTADGEITLIARGERLWMMHTTFGRPAHVPSWPGGYAAPEISEKPLRSDPAPSADVYSIGVLLAEWLLGRRPWRWPDDFATYLDQTHGHHLPLPDTALGNTLAQCLRPDPAARPSLDELAERLRCLRRT